jgi:o-succinylbenzoate---CoA ligase
MLITDAYIEGMCRQVEKFPHERVSFWGHSTPEVILTFFAIWKLGRIACPINTRLPVAPTDLFTPVMPTPAVPTKTEWDLNKPALFISTSGSSGTPKIACLTMGNLVYSALGSNQLIPLTPADCWGMTLPLFHVGGIGILLRTYLAKSSICTDWKKATHLSMVPTQLYRLLKEPQELPLLKTILLGGAPLPKLETPWNVLPTYGMTEMSSQIVTGHKLHPYAELKIGDDQEISVKGKVLFQGYLDQPPQEGLFATGDLGKWENGEFQIIGRKDNMFISGGENIQPEEIEDAIRRICGLMEAVIVPLPDDEFGHRPGVFLNNPADLEKLQQLLKDHLPKYKIPIRAFQLPAQSGLKPSRKLLLKEL